MKHVTCGLTVLLFVAFSLSAVAGDARRERPGEGTLKVGDAAPDFTLKSPDGKQTVTLSSFQGQRPVVLVFASYT